MTNPLSDAVRLLEIEIREIQAAMNAILTRHNPDAMVTLAPRTLTALWQSQLDDVVDHWEALTGRKWRNEPVAD